MEVYLELENFKYSGVKFYVKLGMVKEIGDI